MNSQDHFFKETILCPYCDYEQKEAPKKLDNDDNYTEYDCEHCGETFQIEYCEDWTYSTLELPKE